MNLRLFFFFGLITFLSCTIVHAQEENVDSNDKVILNRDNAVPKISVKLDLVALLLAPKQACYLATDVRISKSLSFEVGAGAYFRSWAFSQYKGETFSGVRARLGLKYYYTVKRSIAPYMGLEVLFDSYKANQYYDVTKYGTMYNLFNGVSRFEGHYIDKMSLTTKTKATGVALKTGIHIFLGSKKNLFFDVYGGVGIKSTNKDRNMPAYPVHQVYRDQQFWLLEFLRIDYDRDPGHYVDPYVFFGVYFGYSFR
jgi:hypothetical protein